MRKFKRLREFILFLAIGIALALPFYRPLLFEDRALLYRDLARDFIVHKTILVENLREFGKLPYWNHFSFGGAPFLAVSTTGPLHPGNIIFLFFSKAEAPRALVFFIWLHYPLIAWGALLFLRNFRLRTPMAFPFALALAGSGYAISAHNLPHILAAIVAVPWFLFFWRSFARQGKRLYFSGACLALAWPLLTGDPQFSFVLGLLACPLYMLWRQNHDLSYQHIGIALLKTTALGFIALGIAAAQLLPALEFASRSTRGFAEMPREELLAFSFHPQRLIELFAPVFFGDHSSGNDFWAQDLVNFFSPTPFIISVYLAIIVIIYLVASLFAKKIQFSLWLISTLGFFVAFGVFSPVPLYAWIAEWLPFFASFRYPERFIFWPLFCLWLLAALEARKFWLSWFRRKHIRPRLFQALPQICLPIPIVLTLLFFQHGPHSLPASGERALSTLLGLLATNSLLLLCSTFAPIPRFRRLLWWIPGLLLTTLQLLDFSISQTRLVWDQSRYIASAERYPMIKAIQQDLQERHSALAQGAARRFSSADFLPLEQFRKRMNQSTLTTFNVFTSLAPNIPGYFGIEDVYGYHSVTALEKKEFWGNFNDHSDPRLARRALDLMGAYYLPSRGSFEQAQLHLNTSALPYVFTRSQLIWAESMRAALEIVREPSYPLEELVVLSPGVDKNIALPASEMAPAPVSKNHEIQILRERDGRSFALHWQPSKHSETAILVWNESFDPYWQATMANEPQTVYRANGWAMAVVLPPGLRPQGNSPLRVEFHYKNPWIYWGFVISGLSLGLLLTMVLLTGSARKQGS